MIIDFHVHAVPPELRRDRDAYVARDAVFAELYADPGAKLCTAEELICTLDECGVDAAVIQNIGWTTLELCRETNDYIAGAVRRFPDRLHGFGAVPPNAGAAALEEISRCAALGLKGIGELRPDTQDFDLADEALMGPFCERLVKHRLMLLLHASEPVGHTYPGKGRVTPENLYPFITRHPELTLILAHWGGGLPFYALMPEVKKVLANVYFDSAASPFLYDPEIYRTVANMCGADHVLFGSDNPLLSPRRALGEIDGLGLPEAAAALIRGGNAARLLGPG